METAGDTRQGAWRAQALDGGLYVVSTPIGNLRDVTLRALDVLASVTAVYAEDTRTTRVLFDAYGLTTPLLAYHEHNAAAVRPKVLERLAEGAAVALVSDAGTPLISDPGYKLVREAAAQGAAVTAVPGASAVLAGLVVAGLATDRFLFAGFLPPKSAARRSVLSDFAKVRATLVFFETGPRLAGCLADMAAVLGSREAVVARELTKRFEEVRRGDLADLSGSYTTPPRGELVVLVGPPTDDVWDADAVDAALAEHLGQHGVKQASDLVAEVAGWAKREVYARALALRANESAGE